MDENTSERPGKRTPAGKPAPIAPSWTATPAPERHRTTDPSGSPAGEPPAHPAAAIPGTDRPDPSVLGSDDTAAGAPAPGDTAAGTTAPGDTATGTTAPGDTATGTAAPGDTATGTPAPGDTATGDGPTGGAVTGDAAAPGDTATSDGPTGGAVADGPVVGGASAGGAVTGGASAAPNPAATTGQVGLRAGDLDRRRVAAVLHDALGKGQLTIAEFDERTATAWSARYIAELDELTADLIPARPGLDAAHVSGTPSQEIQPPASSRVTGDGGPSASVAVFSGFERKGVWTVPEKFTAVAVMGGGVIDIRHANFGAEHVTITATAIMGGIDVIVPDDVHVRVTGVAFMGGFDDARKYDGPVNGPDRDAPTVTINGFAMMGGVSVTRKASGPVPRLR